MTDAAPATHAAMPVWPHDTTAAKIAFYGDFHAANWHQVFLTRITPPFAMHYGNAAEPSILVNKMIAPALLSIFNEIWNACGHDQQKLDATGASDFGGCFNIRPIEGTDEWSNHSWAARPRTFLSTTRGSIGMSVEVSPSISQSLLLQIIEQLSGVDQRIGVLQGQTNEIIREQQRAADGRKAIYDKVNRMDTLEAEIERLSPLVDGHEKKHNQATGAMSLGRVLLSMGSGLFGAAAALAAKWLTEGQPHH